MNRLGSLQMAVRDLGAMRARAAVSAAGIAIGVAVLMVIVGLGLGARDAVLTEVVRQLPVDIVEVVPRTVDIGIFKVGTGGLFGASTLNRETLERLAALDSVAAAYPKLEVNLPLGARGGSRLFGRDLYTDLFLTALPTELIAPEAEAFVDTPDVVPVVISDQLIDIFNGSVASGLNLPQLTSDTLTGFQFEIVVGRSLMLGNRGARRTGVERGRIVGVSRYAMRLGATVPLETGRRLLSAYGHDAGKEETYASILLRARSAADVPAITQAVKAAGLAVDETAQRTSNVLTAATALASLVGLLVLALAALNIAHSFFASLSERRRELAILRAVGARQLDLVLLVLLQAMMMGLAGGVAGVLLAYAVAFGVDLGARALLAGFPIMPDSFVILPPWLAAASLVAAVAAAAAGALWPAMRAARAPLARALSEI